jgi:hypothetical protein
MQGWQCGDDANPRIEDKEKDLNGRGVALKKVAHHLFFKPDRDRAVIVNFHLHVRPKLAALTRHALAF